ncbi:TolC family protein [Hydrogenimonas cancrithermarum]|uniref:Uncharacterized protein n=1 Tax=Hydrogenimonas cancrithermarum TaxID=2993563 RepID=A0ABN6WTU5_9BACT|nr:TolC family protein [Hydrogenimonas cancrithermarum]BDY12298.1 hypothetical protein HCR_06100 [Hydrogenimonas cancrithermarum]
MIRQLMLLATFSAILMASNAVLDYIKAAQKRLQMDRQLQMIEQQQQLGISAKKINRFTSFSVDAFYTDTKADLLPKRFNTTDISLSDTIDIFNKSGIAIEKIRLQAKQNRYLLESQKRQLFLSLIEMIASWHRTREVLQLHRKLYHEQESVLKQLKKAVNAGAMPKIESERFANTLSLFHAKIIDEQTMLETMGARLKLYVPKRTIPSLKVERLQADMNGFLLHATSLRLKYVESELAQKEAEAIQKSWLPEAIVGTAYQQNSDPTANGDNYSVFAGVHISLDAGIGKKAEAARVHAIRSKSQAIAAKIEVSEHYLNYLGSIRSAEKQAKILEPALRQAKSTLKSIKTAYLKHYTDFNSYLQAFQSYLALREKSIEVAIMKQKNILILNMLSSGAIYE